MATTRNKVMWQEGMLMRPHHFQQQQRYNDYLDNQRFRAMNDLSWGFTELTLNNELLAQGKIMIDSASGTLPDGTVFSIPDQDALPDPLHPQNFPDERSRNIYLALPVASDVRNEISDGRRIGRYRLNYADVRDLHSEEGDARTLTLGQLTPRIMSGAEDMSAYITLPLCRISNRHVDGSLTLDDDFIPSCQNIQVSKKLRVYLKEVQGAIGGRASDLANRIGSPAQSGIADVAEFMMLQLLNRNQTRFTHRARRSQLHPEDFYLDLAGLLGELMTFTEPSRLPCPLDVYDHHDLTKTFKHCYRKSNGRCIPYCRQERSICRCICVTVSGRPISMTQNCCNLPPLCWPWRQTCRSIRSSVSLSSSRKFPRRKKSAIWSVCRSPVFHCVPLWWLPASFLTIPGSAISNSTRVARPGQKWLPPGPLHCMFPAVSRI